MIEDEETLRITGAGDTVGGEVVFDRFTLHRQLGAGAFGSVWCAHDRLLERDVALRVLPESVVRDAGAMERLKRAIDLSLEITHPAFVRLYDLVTVEGAAAVSMELVTGESLAAATLKRPGRVWSVVDLAPVLARICEALDHVHLRRGLVHGRLSPERIFLTEDGSPKILGWFESFWRGAADRAEVPASVYAGPEVADGAVPVVATDVYSLGAIVYELLAGGPCFGRGNVELQRSRGLLAPIGTRRRERAESVEPAGPGRAALQEPVPASWETAVAACLAASPAARPPSAGRVMDCIRGLRAVTDRPVSDAQTVALLPPVITEPTRPTVAVSPRRRGTRLWWWVAGSVAALAGFALICGVGAWYFMRRELASRATAESPPATVERVAQVHGPGPGAPWAIPDLGMRFVPVEGVPVLFSIWEVRVKDFAAFVAATRHDATVGMYSLNGRQMGLWGDTWQSPGFEQTPEHPVVGVMQGDGQLFCRWLTERERAAGRLGPDQSYRLPTDDEWEAAGGDDSYEWGSQWPPPPGAGNFADASTAGPPLLWSRGQWIDGYEDGFPVTAPVGSFPPNRFGIHDLSGNVSEFIGSRLHGYRGGSFYSGYNRDYLVRSPEARKSSSISRVCHAGFRVVCVVGGVSAPSVSSTAGGAQ